MKARWIQIRVSEAEHNRLHTLAGIYAGGNLSRYMLDCAERAQPKMLRKKKKERPPSKN